VYHDFQDISEGAIITSSLLLAQHLLLWDLRDRMPQTMRYTLGTLAIGAGVTRIAVRRRDPLVALAFWTCACTGGGLIIGAHWLRSMTEQPADRLIREALRGRYGFRRTAP
jgi:hypothetical protein